MDAVLFNSYGPAEELQLLDVPLPIPTEGMVRIKVTAAGVNPADLKWRAGMFQAASPVSMPHILGYDIAGFIDELGMGVKGFKVGDRVCAMLDPVIKGGYAAFAVTEACNLARVPDAMKLDLASTLPTAALAGTQLIRWHIRPGAGEVVLVTGAIGSVGRFAIRSVIDSGASVVAAVRDGQQEAALALGASRAFILGEDPAFDFRFDHVADLVGGSDVAALCRRVRLGGRIMTLATTPIDPTNLPSAPTFVAVQPNGAMLSDICQLVLDGKVSPTSVKALPLSQASHAHRILESGNSRGKFVLHPW